MTTFTKISLAAGLAVVAGCWFLYARYLAPSGDIDRYKGYYLNDTSAPRDGAVKVTFLGTTSLLIDDGETQLMIDGFLTRPPLSRVLTSKIATNTATVDSALTRLKVERLKGLFVAHSHYDHALDCAYVAQRTNAKLYGSLSTLNIGRGGGLRADQMELYEPGKELRFGSFDVTVLKSRHSPPKPGVNDDLGQLITGPLAQPAKFKEYKEGGSFDFLIRHGKHTILIIPSANYVEGALDQVRADVVFLGTAGLGTQGRDFQDAYYEQTIGKVKPKLVIPVHWDNFFMPLTGHLAAPMKVFDNLPDAFDFVTARTRADGITFKILQGYQSVLLFSGPDGQ